MITTAEIAQVDEAMKAYMNSAADDAADDYMGACESILPRLSSAAKKGLLVETRLANAQADIDYLVARAESGNCCKDLGERDTGVSSNAIVRLAYGGDAPDQMERPYDLSDLAACALAVERMPEHRRTVAVELALAKAVAAVEG